MYLHMKRCIDSVGPPRSKRRANQRMIETAKGGDPPEGDDGMRCGIARKSRKKTVYARPVRDRR